MKGAIVKCVHCDFMDYRDEEPTTCPSCGSKTQKVELPFKDESIIVKVMNTERKIVDSTVTFEKVAKMCETVVGGALEKAIKDAYTRHRVFLMVKAYTWTLLKKHPQLWLDMHILVGGIVEILTLKIEGPKNVI